MRQIKIIKAKDILVNKSKVPSLIIKKETTPFIKHKDGNKYPVITKERAISVLFKD